MAADDAKGRGEFLLFLLFVWLQHKVEVKTGDELAPFQRWVKIEGKREGTQQLGLRAKPLKTATCMNVTKHRHPVTSSNLV